MSRDGLRYGGTGGLVTSLFAAFLRTARADMGSSLGGQDRGVLRVFRRSPLTDLRSNQVRTVHPPRVGPELATPAPELPSWIHDPSGSGFMILDPMRAGNSPRVGPELTEPLPDLRSRTPVAWGSEEVREGSSLRGGPERVTGPEVDKSVQRDVFWRQLCDRPVLYHCRDFLTSEECDAVIRMSEKRLVPLRGKMKSKLDTSKLAPTDARLLESINQRITSLSGVALHQDEVHFTPLSQLRDSMKARDSEPKRMTLGLHVDTNHRERRWLTFIVYLESVLPSNGGHTVFPLALRRGSTELDVRGLSKLHNASAVLLGRDMHHTRNAADDAWLPKDVRESARALLQHAERVASDAAQDRQIDRGEPWWDPSGVGLAVPPERGSCVAFFTRSAQSDGAIDARSWHGGALVANADYRMDSALTPGNHRVGKWTLQKFLEVPPEALHPQSERRSAWLGSLIERTSSALQTFTQQQWHLMGRARVALESFAVQNAFLRPGSVQNVRFEVDGSRSGGLVPSYTPALAQKFDSSINNRRLLVCGVLVCCPLGFIALLSRSERPTQDKMRLLV